MIVAAVDIDGEQVEVSRHGGIAKQDIEIIGSAKADEFIERDDFWIGAVILAKRLEFFGIGFDEYGRIAVLFNESRARAILLAVPGAEFHGPLVTLRKQFEDFCDNSVLAGLRVGILRIIQEPCGILSHARAGGEISPEFLLGQKAADAIGCGLLQVARNLPLLRQQPFERAKNIVGNRLRLVEPRPVLVQSIPSHARELGSGAGQVRCLLAVMHSQVRPVPVDARKHCARLGHIHPQALVIAIMQLGTQAAGLIEHPPSEEGFRLHDQSAVAPVRIDLEEIFERAQRRRLHHAVAAVAVPKPAAAGDDVDIGLLPEQLGHLRERARLVDIVGIQPRQYLAARSGKTLVERIRRACIGRTRPKVDLALVLAQNVESAVGAAAVHHDVFAVRIMLVDHGRNRLLDKAPLIEARRDDREFRKRSAHRSAGA